MKLFIVVLLGAALMGATMGRNLKRIVKGTKVHQPSHRIVDGEEAVPHSVPHQAFLTFSDDLGLYEWLCGGALISESYVLTAGHCTTDAASVEVVLGAHSLTQSESTKQVLTSENITTHESFDETKILNDIGLIRLPKAATLNSAVGVIALSTLSDEELVGKIANITGWGLTDPYEEEEPDALRIANVTIVEDSVCKQWGVYNSAMQICTDGPGNRGPCEGDSGGPLTVEGKLAGLVSYGPSDCSVQDGPDAYTRVSNYLEWIKSHSDVSID